MLETRQVIRAAIVSEGPPNLLVFDTCLLPCCLHRAKFVEFFPVIVQAVKTRTNNLPMSSFGGPFNNDTVFSEPALANEVEGVDAIHLI